MIYAGMRLDSCRRLIFGGTVIALDRAIEVVHRQLRETETYSEAKCQYSDRNMDVLMNIHAQPTTSDHINMKYIWGPHVNHMGSPR